MSRPYAEVIGDPIAQSKSPTIHNFWLGKLGIDAEYRACHVRAEELVDYLARRRGDAAWRGCNVTIPHKLAVLSLSDGDDAKALSVGAANTLFRDSSGALIATNSDVDGIADALAGLDLTGAEVCVIGAGGAARAAFHTLKHHRSIILGWARSSEKAVVVGRECGASVIGVPFVAGSTALSDAKLLINATQLGMSGQELMPAFVLDELAQMNSTGTVFDMVYSPIKTDLLDRARSQGLRTVDGLAMLIGQAAGAFEKFFGKPAPREHDAELRVLLTA